MRIECGPDWDRRIITIEQHPNSGILMSGGLDSWVLYNLLDPSVKIFNLKRVDGLDSYKRVAELTGRTDIVEIDEDITALDRVEYLMDTIDANFNLDYIYIGINHVPPLEHFPEFADDFPVRPWRIEHSDLVMPFLHLYKYHIIDIANQYNINLTNTLSCLTSTESHCGKCWQCRERQWGFRQLDE